MLAVGVCHRKPEIIYGNWNINYISCLCNKLMTSDPLP